jgi:hypothetical protein
MELGLVGGDRRFGGVYCLHLQCKVRDILGYIYNLQEMKEGSGK